MDAWQTQCTLIFLSGVPIAGWARLDSFKCHQRIVWLKPEMIC